MRTHSPPLVLGYEVQYERRRYSKQHVYTWAYVVINDRRYCVGDPYPAVHWRRDLLEEFVRSKAEEVKEAIE